MVWGKEKQSTEKCVEQKPGITSFSVEKHQMLLVGICGKLAITEGVGSLMFSVKHLFKKWFPQCLFLD